MLELVVVIAVAGVLGCVFLDRLAYYQEVAEKTSAELTIINLRAGLRYRVAELLLQHREAELAQLVGSNPIGLLELPPANYVGVRKSAGWDDIPPGNWCFDADKGELLYRVLRARYFVPEFPQQQGLRLRISASAPSMAADGAKRHAEGLSLTLVDHYKWFYKDKAGIYLEATTKIR